MNDKEKKAVKDFRHTLDNPDTKFWIGTDGIKNIDIILNLIEKQKAEIEDAKEYADDVWRHNQELKEKLEGKEYVIETQAHNEEVLLEQLEKKDKMIDLMANSFAEEGFYSEHCQTLIDNDICPDDCNKCIKQYFENKSEEDK